jgi:hypothetical protein
MALAASLLLLLAGALSLAEKFSAPTLTHSAPATNIADKKKPSEPTVPSKAPKFRQHSPKSKAMSQIPGGTHLMSGRL